MADAIQTLEGLAINMSMLKGAMQDAGSLTEIDVQSVIQADVDALLMCVARLNQACDLSEDSG